MAEPLGHERQLTFFKHGGHDHDGENSTPVVLLPGSVQLFHLNNSLLDYLKGITGGVFDSGDDDVVPVPDLVINTPAISPGGSYTSSANWVGLSFVRFMRILMSVDTECTVTFYHKSTFADEDREFRAYRCGNKFLWEGTWAHFDEDNTKRVHFKIENTGNQSASFQLTLKSGTMAANAYARYVEAINAAGVQLQETINLISGNGVNIRVEGQSVIFDAVAPQTVNIARWALSAIKPVSATSSAAIGNSANLFDGVSTTYADFGAGNQWLQVDIGSVVNLGGIDLAMYTGDGRTYFGVQVEISVDGFSWLTVRDSGNLWGIEDGCQIRIVSGYMARYIRVWSNGSTANTGNHVSKIVPLVITNKG
jgi:hypothetical protein